MDVHRHPVALLGALACSLAGAYQAVGQTQHVLEAGSTRAVVQPWNRGVSISVDGVTVATGRYPTRTELARWAGLGSPAAMPASAVSLGLTEGGGSSCCGDSGCC